MKKWLFVVLFLPVFCFGQTNGNIFPVDSSFSVASAFQKITKQFPNARPVLPFVSDKILSEWNVVYRSVGERHLRLDLFYPKNPISHLKPAVVLIHGGGWRSGNKSHLVPLAQKLAENGFVAATVEYRLSIEAEYPAAIYDLKEAVKWLKANAPKYNINKDQIAVLGCSSGATLATFLGVTGGQQKFEGESEFPNQNTIVYAIVNIDGILDFTDPAESGKDNNPDKPSAGALWFGGTYKQIPEKWIEASPINYVGKNTPPTLFVNSALPRFHAGRDSMVAILSDNNIYSEIYTIPNTPHPFWLFFPWFDLTVDYTVAFLNKVFE